MCPINNTNGFETVEKVREREMAKCLAKKDTNTIIHKQNQRNIVLKTSNEHC